MEGTLKEIYKSVQQAVGEGINPVDILNEGMVRPWRRSCACSRKGNTSCRRC